jgi:hypothetical protein
MVAAYGFAQTCSIPRNGQIDTDCIIKIIEKEKKTGFGVPYVQPTPNICIYIHTY